jgi:Ca2+-binding RTX toxin-like protein
MKRPDEQRFTDLIYADKGNDKISGRFIELTFEGSARPARVNLSTRVARGAGKDRLSGVRIVTGSRYADRLVGSGRADELNGGAGADRLVGNGGGDMLDSGRGNDTVLGGPGSDVAFQTRGVARLGGGNDFAMTLWATVYGDAGDDIVMPFGRSTINGGAGVDTLALETFDFSSDSGVTADLAAGTADIGAPVTFTLIEALEGSMGPDILYGDANANVINGGDGDDKVFGLGGDDKLNGGDGDDSVDGGDGTDTCSAETTVLCE